MTSQERASSPSVRTGAIGLRIVYDRAGAGMPTLPVTVQHGRNAFDQLVNLAEVAWALSDPDTLRNATGLLKDVGRGGFIIANDPSGLFKPSEDPRADRVYAQMLPLINQRGMRGGVKPASSEGAERGVDVTTGPLPRLTRVTMESPLEIVASIPSEFVAGGAIPVLMVLVERLVTFPLRLSTSLAKLRAERAGWEAERSQSELKIVRLQAEKLRLQGSFRAQEAELFDMAEPDVDTEGL